MNITQSPMSMNSLLLLGKNWANPGNIGTQTPGTITSTVATATRLIFSANGDSSNLSFTWTSDSDTGVYRSGNGEITWISNGGVIMIMSPTGVNIGDQANSGLQVGSGNIIYKIFVSSASYTFTVNANSVFDQVIAVSDVSVGDLAQVIPPSTMNAGLMFSTFVSAADQITIRIHNTTGSGVTFTDIIFKVAVFSFNAITP